MSQKRKEIDVVTQKVQNTKKEIDHLKAELEKLIKSGINSATQFKPITVNKENFVHNTHESQNLPEPRITFRTVSDADKNSEQKCTRISRRDAPILQATRSDTTINRNTSKSPDCTKKCSYNKEEAREYIKKQKEKRKELAKLSSKDNVIHIQNRKQKLLELHKKSLLLVKKNVEQKRKRSKSREIVQQTENVAQERNGDESHAVSHIPDLIMTNVIDNKNKQKSAQKPNDVNGNSSRLASNDFKDSSTFDEQIKNVMLKRNYEDEALLPSRKDLECKAATKIQACYRGYQQRKHINNRKKIRETHNQRRATAETQTETVVPNWLNPLALSQPYNFINTVKRKLNFAINSPSNNLHASSSNFEPKTPKQELFQKTKNDLKEVIEKSAKSNKTNNGNLWDLISQKRAEIGNKFNNEHSETVHNSDSDTSKNIPTISSESNIHSRASNKNKRTYSVATKKDISLDTDYPTDSDFSDAKLNTERLKDLKLKRKKSDKHSATSSSTVKTIKSFSESDIISSNSSKYNLQNVENFTSKNLVTADDIIAFNVSPTRAVEQLQPPSNLALNLPKGVSQKSTSQSSLVQTEVRNSEKNSYSCNFSAVSSRNLLTIPNLEHPDITIYPMEEALKEPKATESVISLKEIVRDAKMKAKPTRSSYTSDFSVVSSNHSDISVHPVEQVSKQQKTTINAIPRKEADIVAFKSSSKSSYSSDFSVASSKNLITVPNLQHPDISIYSAEQVTEPPKAPRNVISLKEGDKATLDTKGSVNEIHLKIEAELHLLNDFNESLKKFVDLEKSVLELRDKHQQSSVTKKQDTKKSESDSEIVTEKRAKETKNINYSRGCDVTDNMSFYSLNSDLEFEKGILSNGLEISDFNVTKSSTVSEVNNEHSVVIDESLLKAPFVGVSLGMFEQLIKDEDTRIENLKTILKIREKALLDRTKSELALLEIQKKHLKETGQLHEASLLKKKQRGILMRLQHEHHEMQRLKQMQKTASKERKAALKQQRNMIKAQLSTNKMLTKTKLNTPRENQRHSGPFKVYNIQSESVRSETSISRNSITEEVISVTSHSRSVVSRASSDVEVPQLKNENVKSLLMREAALQKRRKEAEELLQWHKKLMEEEKKVAELEMVANSIINEVSKANNTAKMTKKQTQRNREIHKYKSDKDSSYDSINTDIEYSSDVKTDVFIPKKSESDKQTLNNYTSDFEPPTSQNNKETSIKSTPSDKHKHSDKIASITELIDNLTKINEENSILSKRSSLNKSIDTEIDKIVNRSKSPPKNFKIETNKLLDLKEHLHLDNSKAILDSIENLRSSIQEITSKADRSRSSRKSSSKSETQGTEKDVSEITSNSFSIPKDFDQHESETSTSENSQNLLCGSDSVQDESSVQPSAVASANEKESDSFETISLIVAEEENINSEQETHSNVTVEENKTIPNNILLIESECDNKTIETSEEQVEEVLSASSPFIEAIESNSIVNQQSEFQEKDSEENELDVFTTFDQINHSPNCEGVLKKNEVETNNLLYQPQYEDISDVSESNNFSFSDQPKDIGDDKKSEEISEVEAIPDLSTQSNDEKSEMHVDVKKRVSEILADANCRNERSPRIQDLYVTTYDLNSPECSPESYSPSDNNNADIILSSKVFYDSEAEELLKKQLAIEQEIKQIQQQQKEHIPYLFVREIPNKPPPPYTPPVTASLPTLPSVLPSAVDQIDIVSDFATDILYRAHLDNNLETVTFDNETIHDDLLKNVEKSCLKFLFDLCKELTLEHYERFKTDEGPSWMKQVNKQRRSVNGPFGKGELKTYLNRKVKILLGYEKIERRENAIIRWSRKKRDHVDEILVLESQAEESEWTNYDKDELYVKNEVTNEIMNMLLSETAEVLSKVLKNKSKKLLF